jgi:hypothetical protein
MIVAQLAVIPELYAQHPPAANSIRRVSSLPTLQSPRDTLQIHPRIKHAPNDRPARSADLCTAPVRAPQVGLGTTADPCCDRLLGRHGIEEEDRLPIQAVHRVNFSTHSNCCTCACANKGSTECGGRERGGNLWVASPVRRKGSIRRKGTSMGDSQTDKCRLL